MFIDRCLQSIASINWYKELWKLVVAVLMQDYPIILLTIVLLTFLVLMTRHVHQMVDATVNTGMVLQQEPYDKVLRGVLPIPHLQPTPVNRHIELWHLRYQRQIQVLRCQQAVTRRQVRVLPLLRKLLQVPYQVLEPRRTLALLQHSPRQRQLQQRLVCLLQTQQ